MQRQTLELVTFQTISSTNEKALIENALRLTPILAAMPGFINRHFAKSEAGEWIDVVIWDSKENAETAAKTVMDIPEAKPFFSLIDKETVNLRHATIQT